MNVNKNLSYYMSLNYPIEIVKIPSEEGGGYMATIPQLGRNVFVGDGESVDEALKNLEFVKEEWFKTYLERGREIPLPEEIEDKEYSGKFILRISPTLHRQLAKSARKSNQSLNQYLVQILSSASAVEEVKSHLEVQFDLLRDEIRKYRWINKDAQNYKIKIKPALRPYANISEKSIIAEDLGLGGYS